MEPAHLVRAVILAAVWHNDVDALAGVLSDLRRPCVFSRQQHELLQKGHVPARVSIPGARPLWPIVYWSRHKSPRCFCSLRVITDGVLASLGMLCMSACTLASGVRTIKIPRQGWELHFHACQPISYSCLHSQGSIVDQLSKGRRAVGLPARCPLPRALLLWCLWLRSARHCLGLLWRSCLRCQAPAPPLMPAALPKGLFTGCLSLQQ